MKRAWLAGIALVSLGMACTEKGRSVVLVDVTVQGQAMNGPVPVRVHVTEGNRSIGHIDGDWTGTTLKLGVYLPKSVSGSKGVVVCGFDGQGGVLSAASQPASAVATVSPGESSGPVQLTLMIPGTPPSVCAGADGGMGGGGAGGGDAGTGGAAGTGGGGGSAGGTGGSTGGIGPAGSGGGAGTGGAGGSAGTGGAGGISGTSGTVGTAGRGGGGGSAGTGGAAGGGGTTGTGGGGTTGTGAASWRGSTPVANDPGQQEIHPSVAVAFNGKAVVVYERSGEIWGSCYDSAAAQPAWTAPTRISVGSPYQLPVVVADGTGQFTAAWAHGMVATSTGIWQATSPDCLNWTQSQLATTNAAKPALAANSNGAAIVAWSERLPSQQAVARIRPTASGSFGPPVTMKDADTNSDRNPVVGMTTVGEALVVWEQISAGMDSIYWRKSDTAGAWPTAAALLETYDGGRSYAPAIATNGNNAIITYLQRTGTTTTQLTSHRYLASTGIGNAMAVDTATEIDGTVPPSVTLDNAGTATAAWGRLTGATYNVHVKRLAMADNAWPSMPVAMENDNAATEDLMGGTTALATMPVVRSDGFNVIVVWRKRVPLPAFRFDIYAKRYSAGGWDPQATKLDSLDGVNNAFNPVLGINGSGVAVAAWYHGGDVSSMIDVYANVFR